MHFENEIEHKILVTYVIAKVSILLSLLNAGIMKWTKRCTTLTTLALPIIEWWIVWFVFLLWEWSSLDSGWTAITGVIFFGLPVYGMAAVQALSVLDSSANVSQKI